MIETHSGEQVHDSNTCKQIHLHVIFIYVAQMQKRCIRRFKTVTKTKSSLLQQRKTTGFYFHVVAPIKQQ